MKKKPASKSAFFNTRVLLGLAFCLIGLVLTLVAFALYPGGNALARQNQSSALDQSSFLDQSSAPDQSSVQEPQDNGPSLLLPIASETLEPNYTFGSSTTCKKT